MTPSEKRARTMASRTATPPTPPPTADGLRATLAGIAARRAATAERVGAIIAERRPLALAAHEGDAAAVAQVAALNAESVAMVNEMDRLADAEGEVRRLLGLAEAAEMAVLDGQREAERQEAVRGLMKQADAASEAVVALGRLVAGFRAATRSAYALDERLADQLTRRLPQALQAALGEAGIAQAAGMNAGNARKSSFRKILQPVLEGALAQQGPRPAAKPAAQVLAEVLHENPEPPNHGDALKAAFQAARAEAPEPTVQPAREDAL